MYCSETCLEADKKEFHQFVCGIVNAPHDKISNFSLLKMLFKMLALFDGNVDKLREFLEASPEDQTIFDFDFSNIDDPTHNKNFMLATLSKKNCKETWKDAFNTLFESCQRLIQFHPKLRAMWNTTQNQKFLNGLLRKLYFTIGESKRVFCLSKVNINLDIENPCLIEIDNSATNLQRLFPGVKKLPSFQNHVMTAVDPFINLINHSCIQNVVTQNVGEKNALVVLLPIKKGEQIFSNYEGTMLATPKERRQAVLRDLHGFECDCIACEQNMPMHNKLEPKEINQQHVFLSKRVVSATSQDISIFYMRCDIIKQNYDLFPCQKIYYFLAENVQLLATFAQPASWFGGK